jgi:diketogulonate reductase-like aldo/keto reductase
MVPIPGTSSLDHLEENVGARSLRLSDEEVVALDRYRTSRAHSLRRQLRHRVRPLALPIVASLLVHRSGTNEP